MSHIKELSKGTKIGKYRVDFLIGCGGFGHVYKVIDSNTHQSLALKTEQKDLETSFLKNELEIMSHLDKPCFPIVRDQGQYKNFNYYVMNIYGLSIHALRQINKLDLDMTLPICYKMFTIIQTLHQLGYIHRDIKPSNYLLQQSQSDPFVLVDFGLALQYLDPKTGKPIQIRDRRFAGTKKYASIFSLKQNQLGRRDDLISWVYSTVEVITGSLPWSSCENEDELLSVKEKTTPDELCKDVPERIRKVYKYLLTLSEDECPAYSKIDKYLQKSLTENNIDLNNINWQRLYIANADLEAICSNPKTRRAKKDGECIID